MNSSFAIPLQVRRMTAGALNPDTGVYAEGTEQQFEIMGSVQPASGKDMLSLEEGRRTRAAYVIFTATELKVDGRAPDRIKLFKEDYEVVHVEPWRMTNLSHYRALVQKIQAVN